MITFRVKVRRTTYLWGGEQVVDTVKTDSKLYLHFRVDEGGEVIAIGVRQAGKMVPYGSLAPGQSFSVRLTEITGVYATIPDPQDTMVDCYLVQDRD